MPESKSLKLATKFNRRIDKEAIVRRGREMRQARVDATTGEIIKEGLQSADLEGAILPQGKWVNGGGWGSDENGNYVTFDVDFKNPDDTVVARVRSYDGVQPGSELDAEITQGRSALLATYDQIEDDPNGKLANQTMADDIKDSASAAANGATYEACTEEQKATIEENLRDEDVAVTDKMKKEFAKARKRQDPSRVSKEYHEWKYCTRGMGDNWGSEVVVPGIAHTADAKTLFYTPDSGTDPPPYHEWVELKDMRKLWALIRRLARARRKAGGAALFAEQGHADLKAAVKADLAVSDDFSTIATALAADSHWAYV